jgi:hydrogenase 3 maturation protease
MSSLSAKVQKVLKPKPGINVIITVGNPLRSDDGVGPYIAEKLTSSERTVIIDAGYNPENIIDKIIKLKPSKIVIIDAADFKGKVGEVRLIDKDAISEITLSTHTIPLGVIAHILSKDTRAEINFLGIQPKSVAIGGGMCSRVKKAAHIIIRNIEEGTRNA